MEIIECDITNLHFIFSVGNESSHIISKIISALKLQVKNSRMTWSDVIIKTHKLYSIVALSVKNCLFINCVIEKAEQGGFVGAVIENCNFVGDSQYAVNGIFMSETFSVIVKNCTLVTIDGRCIFGCAIYFKGLDGIEKKRLILKEVKPLLLCHGLDYDLYDSELVIENTVLTGSVKTAGSAIFCEDANLKMINSSIILTEIGEGGYIHFSTLQNFAFKAWNSNYYVSDLTTEHTIMSLTAPTIDVNNVTISCSKGLKLIEKDRYPTKLFKCEYSCPKNLYTFETGNMILEGVYEQWKMMNLSKSTSDIKCFTCPVGANCDKKLCSLPNYWGYMDKREVVTMIRCPDDYCCKSHKECIGIQSCNKGRAGTLCGTCGDNFTESLYSSTCIPSQQCQRNLIWILYSAAVVSYATILIIGRIIRNRFLHILTKCKAKCSFNYSKTSKIKAGDHKNDPGPLGKATIEVYKTSSDIPVDVSATETIHNIHVIDSKDRKPENSGLKYLQILFYYVQDATLFKVYLPMNDSQSVSIVVKLLSFSPDILALYVNMINLCQMHLSGPVEKIILKSVFGFCIMFFLLLVFIAQKVLSVIFRKHSSLWKNVEVSLTQAFVLCLLFSFQEIIKGSFSIVQCVQVEGHDVLYVQGNINCYTWWQIVTQVYICLNIVPQVLVLAIFPFYVQEKRMKVITFILACLLPVPGICYFFITNLKNIRRTREEKGKDEISLREITTATVVEEDIATKTNEKEIVCILLKHYKCLSVFGIRFTWLGIHKFYRLILVACNTYVTEPVPKLLAMTSVLIVITIGNIFLKPYKDSRANKTATLSYMANLCIAIINLWKTGFITFGCETNFSLKEILLWYFDLAENILLNWLPIFAVGVWLMYAAVEKCRSKSNNE